jgi:hypothetical protein
MRGKQDEVYTRQNTSSPSNQAIGMANTNFPTQEGSNQSISFLNGKNHTPSEVENTKFYQLSLDKSQVKIGPLKQQSK